jgi:hypothetical protein
MQRSVIPAVASTLATGTTPKAIYGLIFPHAVGGGTGWRDFFDCFGGRFTGLDFSNRLASQIAGTEIKRAAAICTKSVIITPSPENYPSVEGCCVGHES